MFSQRRLLLIALGLGCANAAAGVIVFSGTITQSTQDGTGLSWHPAAFPIA
jgi:hypothetical protein